MTITTPGDVSSTRRLKTRERLMDAAYEVFAERGVHAASVEMVTEKAGFTRGAFYSNFETKEELFFALAERENRTRFEMISQGLAAVLPSPWPEGELAQVDKRMVIDLVFAEYQRLQSEDRSWCLVHSEFKLLAMRDPEIARAFLEMSGRLENRLAEILVQGIGMIGLKFSMEPRGVARIIFDVYESALQRLVLSGRDVSPEFLAELRATVTELIASLTVPA